jgi:hypothetical protein
MAIFLPKDTSSDDLSTSISSPLLNLIDQKFGYLKQKNEQSKMAKTFQALMPGIDPQKAHALAGLDPADRKQYFEMMGFGSQGGEGGTEGLGGGKVGEASRKKQEKEQEQLQKLYGEKVEKISQKASAAETTDTFLDEQAQLVNSGNMPNPMLYNAIESMAHAAGPVLGGAAGGAIGSLAGPSGTVGGALAGSKVGSSVGDIKIAPFFGDSLVKLMSNNVQQYDNFKNIFSRGTEQEFVKYERKLLLPTDSDKVKIEKLNSMAYENDVEKIRNKYVQKTLEENNNKYVPNIIAKAEKLGKKELADAKNRYLKGNYRYRLNYVQKPKKIEMSEIQKIKKSLGF